VPTDSEPSSAMAGARVFDGAGIERDQRGARGGSGHAEPISVRRPAVGLRAREAAPGVGGKAPLTRQVRSRRAVERALSLVVTPRDRVSQWQSMAHGITDGEAFRHRCSDPFNRN
jgi:hypothetical protein